MDKIAEAYTKIKDKRKLIIMSESFLIDLLDEVSGITDENLLENVIEDTIQFFRNNKNKLNEAVFNPGGINWLSDHEANSLADATSHSLEDAKHYVKTNYPHTKTYSLHRVGGNGYGDTEATIRKSAAGLNSTDAAIAKMGLKRNSNVSGSSVVSRTIHFGWHTHENPESGHAILYYADGGMGSDEITIAGKTKKHLDNAVDTFRQAGVLPDLSDLKAKREENSIKRNKLIQKKELTIGQKIGENINGNVQFHEIHSFLPSGKIKVKKENGDVVIQSPS
jgi:hypothetical protein